MEKEIQESITKPKKTTKIKLYDFKGEKNVVIEESKFIPEKMGDLKWKDKGRLIKDGKTMICVEILGG